MTSSAKATAATSSARVQWTPVQGPSEALSGARVETLNLVQWLARIANSYVAGGSSGDKVTLDVRADGAAFVTRTFEDKIALEIRLPSLEMQFLENGKPIPHILDPEEHSPAEVEAWLLVELLHRGVDRSKFSKTLPYKIEGLMSGDAEDHSPQQHRAGLKALAAWYANAASVLTAAAGGKARAVCQPQTLELVSMPAGARSTVFGFSPGEAQDPEPYFFRQAANGGNRATLKAIELMAQRDPAATALAFLVPN